MTLRERQIFYLGALFGRSLVEALEAAHSSGAQAREQMFASLALALDTLPGEIDEALEEEIDKTLDDGGFGIPRSTRGN